MRQKRSDGEQTRQVLLITSAKLFAENGFRATTLAAISAAAGANTAAVNYHFGSKEDLYIEAWQDAFQRSVLKYPPGSGIPDSAPPEIRLRGHILSVLNRLFDSESLSFDIAQQEMACPTGLLAEVMAQCIEPMRQRLRQIVQQLVGSSGTTQEVELCVMSTTAQMFGPMRRERHIRLSGSGKGKESRRSGLPVTDLEALADHITAFSLAGIKAIRLKRHYQEKTGVTT